MARLKNPKPVTAIGSTHSDTETLSIRGRDTLTEIMGKMTFTESFFFIVTGEMPDPRQTAVFDACLNILMDHGLTPSALVARLVEDAEPDNMQVGMAAGLLVVANRHVGTMTGAGRILAGGPEDRETEQEWAARIVAEHRAAKKRLPGFGHPHYAPDDPRARRLFEIAMEANCDGMHIRRLRLIEAEIEKSMGRHLTLNVTGAMAAVLTEIGFPVEGMRGVAVVGRAAGLVAHMVEEKETGLARHMVNWADEMVETAREGD